MTGGKILVLGDAGQVGRLLTSQLRGLGELVFWTRRDRDLQDLQLLPATLDDVSPDILVNAAAFTAVDAAEEEEAIARTVNAELPACLARWCRQSGARLVHYSSDYVFDGSSDAPYSETHPMNPLSAYGRTKAEGDQAVLESGADATILRPSWVYSAESPCFFTTIAKLAQERDTLRIVADQIGSPTPAAWLAKTTATLLRGSLPTGPEAIHCVPAGSTSYHGFATAIVDGLKRRGIPVAAGRIDPVTTEEFPRPAPRPKNSRLAIERLERRLGRPAPSWQIVLDPVLDLYAAIHSA